MMLKNQEVVLLHFVLLLMQETLQQLRSSWKWVRNSRNRARKTAIVLHISLHGKDMSTFSKFSMSQGWICSRSVILR